MDADFDEQARAAVRVVVEAHGLAQTQLSVVHSGSNIVVRLCPAPVVARVMTGTAALHDDPQRWLEREVSVEKFLAASGLAVAPSSLIPPGPFEQDGLWMTFSEWIPSVSHPRQLDDAPRFGQALRSLHETLRASEGDLGDMSDLRSDIERLHGLLEPTDAPQAEEIASLRARLDGLKDVFETSLSEQALHGDVSLSNLLQTTRGLIWNDFEDTFRGPIHWDVASYVESLRFHGMSSRFVRAVLDAYGWDDERQLAPFMAAQGVYYEIWQMYDHQRRNPED